MNRGFIIDPPSGWKYGFPAEYKADRDGDMGEFLASKGYAREDIDFALRYMRMWPSDEEESYEITEKGKKYLEETKNSS